MTAIGRKAGEEDMVITANQLVQELLGNHPKAPPNRTREFFRMEQELVKHKTTTENLIQAVG